MGDTKAPATTADKGRGRDKDGKEPLIALSSTEVASLSYPSLTERKQTIAARLQVLAPGGSRLAKKRSESSSSSKTTSNNTIPLVGKSDTHWDFLLKEMMWLAADFSSERKRQLAMGKKVGGAIVQFHKTRSSRRVKELAEAELKRRRLAGRMGREVKGWWHKIEKVIAYKQKVEGEVERRKAMNKQLVALVSQTERYGESLASTTQYNDGDNGEYMLTLDDDNATSSDSDSGSARRRKKKRQRRRLTIEEALAEGSNEPLVRRSTKGIMTDYARLDKQEETDDFYGETTTSDSGSDGSFVLETYSTDDESTLLEAEVRELAERRAQVESDDDDNASYYADPDELRKLEEEADMDVGDVVERFKKEAVEAAATDASDEENVLSSSEGVATRRVRFARNVSNSNTDVGAATSSGTMNGNHHETANVAPRTTRQRVAQMAANDPGNEADDDADASDVEDFVIDHDSDSDGSAEFEANNDEIDDESTIAAEERLGRELSADEEMRLLKQESDMSIEDLRKMYSSMENGDVAESDKEEIRPDPPAVSGGITSSSVVATRTRSRGNEAMMNEEAMPDEDMDVSEDADEFNSDDAMEVDDETTIEAEERLGREMSHEQEMSLLQQEGEIPIEELRTMYAEMEEECIELDSIEGEAQSQSSVEDGESLRDLLDHDESDEGDDFRPDAVAVDDETTMEAEEKLGRDISYEDELKLLKRESEMSVEELRRIYSEIEPEADEGDGQHLDESAFSEDDHESEDEFRPVVESIDDETTIDAEERLGREMTVEDEIALLQRDGATPIEDLRAMYKRMEDGDASSDQDIIMDNNHTEHHGRQGRKRSRPDDRDDDGKDDNDGEAALVALKVAEERARMTQATRPFLIAPWVKLREYQQIGLNWLVSIQTRRLNGILADEMGLGKTLQTITLLAYLASYKGIWGPHLIVVPTSVIVNWETEFKRFAPGLKVLCYYGSAKRRKELRSGWTKTNWHHVIVTSYQLVVQDSFAFKRKKWYYLILDEAHNIKNFESQRWQTLINFNTQRRLLLTGTPLQNNLMELWSLLHFLMPHVFRSRKEFSYWFSNPMNNIIEGNTSRSDDLINRLHGIIRPFVLRRLKKDVEKQMPGKFEHIIKCQLSRRQMFLYEEFMARSSTRQALRKGGNFMGMMNVLMQLRKVCNHPDLFEPRSVVTPFVMERVSLKTAGDAVGATKNHPISESLSVSLTHPLWSCASGVIDQDLYMDHDTLTAEQLGRLEQPSSVFASGVLLDSFIDEPRPTDKMDTDMAAILTHVRLMARKNREEQADFQKRLNAIRCRAPAFPYSSRLVDAVEVETSVFDRESPEIVSGPTIVSTPSQLLALRKSQHERADDVDDLMKKFVFCVPKVGAPRPILDVSVYNHDNLDDGATQRLLTPLEKYFEPFRKAHARLSSFFPDKKLIQFDAGKLQTLAKLMRELKQGGHRALIFTQMSKMLDVLEAFLNLNGFTYLRLDGSTGVDKRQRMMDRFNNDPKIFCFILSTRSGGLGINLTGADSVIFYDSDWNPAMDAQAQDRAHRIGQTRDVHIYRLITEHSIEENILTKAQQKRNLDLLVMDEGKFDASSLQGGEDANGSTNGRAKSDDVFTKGGLRTILGVAADESDEERTFDGVVESEQEVTKEQMEQTMASLEDEDDVRAMRGAKKEAAEDLKEFDETIEYSKEEGEEDGNAENGERGKAKSTSKKEIENAPKEEAQEEEKKSEADMQQEFDTWQSEVGMDTSSIEASLSPTERYALNFREDIDPFYSMFAINEYKRKMEAQEDTEEIDLDDLERQKVLEERRALEEGDLLGTFPQPEDLLRQRHLFSREKSRLRSNKKIRKLTGENWETRVDSTVDTLYWYNVDTGEAIWDKPAVLLELEECKEAAEKHWSALPIKPLIRVMEYLIPFPERMNCSTVCRHWRTAASDISFVRHVYPVEMSALLQSGRQLEHNHFRTIEEAVAIALPGDTIELGDGHYWVSAPGLKVNVPLRFIGDEHDPSHVIVELSGVVDWSGKGGWMEGVTLRRPRMASDQRTEILRLHSGGRVDMDMCVFDNEGSHGPVALVTGATSRGDWLRTDIKGSEADAGVVVESGGLLNLQKCNIMNNHGPGLCCNGASSSFQMKECIVQGNIGSGVCLRGASKGELTKCRFARNHGGILDKDDTSTCSPCSSNVAVASTAVQKALPGFRVVKEPSDSKQEAG